jgi:hypothetical protein
MQKTEIRKMIKELRVCKSLLLLESEKAYARRTGDYSLLRYFSPETPKDNVVYVT